MGCLSLRRPRSKTTRAQLHDGPRIARARTARSGFTLTLMCSTETEFPATDYLMSGGISLAVGRELAQTLGGDERLVGVSVGCYNPEKDSSGSNGAELVELAALLTGASA